MRDWLKTNQGIGSLFVIALVAFLIYLQLSPWVHRKVRDGFALGFFPVLATILMIIFSVVLIFDRHQRRTTGGMQDFTGKSFLGGLVILIGTGVYFLAMQEIGFLIVTPCYLTIFIYMLGLKSWRTNVISALIMTGAVYGAFSAIGINIPAGILDGVLFF